MSKRVNPDAVIRKLTSVSNTQDSIAMLGVWIICNKHEHKLIADKWLEVLKSAKSQHQLTLLYLCNDVIQKCARKNASVFKKAFEDVIPEAITHIRRDEAIRKNVERVLAIWKKRKIYDSEFVDQLMATLVANRPPDILKNKLLQEYKTATLLDALTHIQNLEEQLKIKKAMVEKLQPCDTEKIKKLKDKEGGKKFKNEFEEQRDIIRSYQELVTEYLHFKKTLYENLQNGQIYYHAQYHEAKVVATAYHNYETRLLQTKQGMSKVMERVKTLHPSPPQHDIPSPGGSIDKLPGNDDMDISDDEQYQPSNDECVISPSAFRGANDGLGINLPAQLLANAAAATMDKSAVEQIIRSTNMAGWKSNNNNNGGSSPPSPVGSSDLNIGSPPRHQSLDSRLADIFMDGGGMKNVRDMAPKEEDSDAGSLAGDGKAKETNFLPGLGGDQVGDQIGDQINDQINDQIDDHINDKISDIISSLIGRTSPKSSPGGKPVIDLSQFDGISIPVIQGLVSQAAYASDAAATPTQDEVYTPGELAYDGKKGLPKTPSLDFLCSFITKKPNDTSPPSQSQEPQSTASDFASRWNDSQVPTVDEAPPPAAVENKVIPDPFQQEGTPPHNEEDANAWLAAYSPAPSDDQPWQEQPISTTPPLPPQIAVSLNTKPPMPPGPEPPQINDISPIRARTSSRDRLGFDQEAPLSQRRNSSLSQVHPNNNLITVNSIHESNNSSHYRNNNIDLTTPVKDRDLRQPGHKIHNNLDRPTMLMRQHDNPCGGEMPNSPPRFPPAFARQDSNGPPQFSPKYEENLPYDDHRQDANVMISRSNSIEHQRFVSPQTTTSTDVLPSNHMMHQIPNISESPMLPSPHFPYMSPSLPKRGNSMRPHEQFTGPRGIPNHSHRRPHPSFRKSSPGPETKRFCLPNPHNNNNFHGEPHQNRPPVRHSSPAGNNFPSRSPPHMRFRNVRPSNQTRFARNNVPFEPRAPHHRGTFPRMYNS